LLLPCATLAATSLADATLSDVVFTGVSIVGSVTFVILGRDLLVVLVALPVALALTSLALPPQSLEVGTRAGVLAACVGLGAALAFAFQVYRGLLWHAEQTIRAAYERAQEASAAKSVFLATMSHELRTPMTGVLGTADLLATAPSLGAEERGYVNTIRESGRALLRVIDDILDFSKVEAGALLLDPEPSDVNLEVVGAVTLMAPVAKAKDLELRIEVVCDPPTQVFDRTRFRQILLNLISNAVKFTEQGHVSVTVTSKRRSDREIVLTCAVEDTGPGVPDEQQASMFEPFVQLNAGTTRAHGGTGLGLAICARLARLMGGDIRVGNAAGGGSLFEFTIVTRDAGHEQGRERTGEVTLPFHPVASVLVVDDQALNRQVVAAMLKQVGYGSVEVVTGGAAAVSFVSDRPVDIVLMDMQMPEVDGIEATKRIRAGGANVPYIVALTANVLESDRERCLKAGMNDYLAKPVTMDTLRRTMRRAERAVRERAGR
jgi:signal transduction histidine kinase/ActR/RegA family two-component response regulator